MHGYCCSGGNDSLAETVPTKDKINVDPLCLPRALMLILLIVPLKMLLSYQCTRETQRNERDVVVNVDNNEVW